jgi:uncharacterized protein (DUF58 family)
VITARGLVPFVIAAMLTLVAAPLGAERPVFAVTTLVALAVVGWDWQCARVLALDVERPHAGPFSIGRLNALSLVVTGDPTRPVAVEVRDAPTATATLEPAVHRLSLEPGERRDLPLELVPRRRGEVDFAAVGARVLGPRGLAFSQRRFAGTAWNGLTWPDVLQLRDEKLLPPGRRAGGLRAGRTGDRGSEFESLRAYVPGDEFRRISWKASARRGQPVIENRQPERRQSLVMVVEAGRLMAGAGGGGLAKLDRSVNTAVMLSAVAREFDDAVGLVTFASQPMAALGAAARSGQVRRVVETLAPLEAELAEPDWGAALRAVARVAGPRAVIVIFSDLHYVETDPALAARIATLTRKHRVLFASVADQSLATDARIDVDSSDTLYRRGTAVSLLQRRRRAELVLQRRGVRAFDTSPDELTARVVSAFRELRRSGE